MDNSYDGGVSSERERRTDGWVARLALHAPELLRHAALLLAMWGAAGMATGTRLRWEVIMSPRVYRAGAVMLPLLCVALLTLGHLALVALRRRSRALLLLYAVLMTLLAVVGSVGATWALVELTRVVGLLRDYYMRRDHEFFANHRPRRSTEVDKIFQDMQSMLPEQGHLVDYQESMLVRLRVAAALLALLVLLQAAAVLLALLASYDMSRPGTYPISKDALASWWSQCRCDMKKWGRARGRGRAGTRGLDGRGAAALAVALPS